MVGNVLALLTLLSWPVISAIMFQRMEARRAFVWSILGAYMSLSPLTAVALPVIPDMDKTTLPNIAAALLAMGAGHRVLTLPGSPLMKLAVILFIIAPWTAIFANQQPLVEGISYRPAQNAYDSFTTMVKQAAVVLPLVMAVSYTHLRAHET